MQETTPIENLVIYPSDCVIIFTLPGTQIDFNLQKLLNEKDFVRNCCSSWAKYDFEILEVFRKLITELEPLGVKVVLDATFNKFIEQFKDKKLIILIAHWHETRIEFFDMMVEFSDLAAAIPLQFLGVLDLCVCTPMPLVNKIKVAKPRCVVRFSHLKVTLEYWLHYYSVFFKYLFTSKCSFFEAFEIVTKQFIKE